MQRSFCGFIPAAGAALLALAVTGTPAHAQVRRPPGVWRAYPPYNYAAMQAAPVNPDWQIAPGLTLQQYAFNMAVLSRARASVPPYALGFNPSPPPIVYYSPVYLCTPSSPPTEGYLTTRGADANP